MLLIYTPEIKPRLRYTFQLIFGEILGIEFKLTTDAEKLEDFIGPKFNYSQQVIDKEIFIYAHDILLERGIHAQNIEHIKFGEDLVPFAHHHPTSLFPFDLFAASFYMVSRYEEYLPFTPDKHGRFPAKESIANRLGFLEKPVVNFWAKALFARLTEDYPLLESKPIYQYDFIPTYDIDIAFAYKHKGFFRNLGGLLRDVKNTNFPKINERCSVIVGRKEDPYDTLAYQYKLQKKYDLHPIYFFPVGDYGAYDKNIAPDRFGYKNLIQSIGDTADVGLHPSYRSNTDQAAFLREKDNLIDITKRPVIRSRQHYVKLKFPETYENLIDHNIYKDYSMGYPDALGFRAGIASSFLFYDLSREMQTVLRVYPFAMMDVTFRFYLKLSQEESLLKIRQLIREVHRVNGLLISVWHNNSLSETDGWENWRGVYEKLVEWAVQK